MRKNESMLELKADLVVCYESDHSNHSHPVTVRVDFSTQTLSPSYPLSHLFMYLFSSVYNREDNKDFDFESEIRD